MEVLLLKLDRGFPIKRLVQEQILRLLGTVILSVMAIQTRIVEAQVAHMVGELMTRPTPVLHSQWSHTIV